MLLAEIDSLDAQKHLFIKDIKRIRNEDSSRFNACPILNERYASRSPQGQCTGSFIPSIYFQNPSRRSGAVPSSVFVTQAPSTLAPL